MDLSPHETRFPDLEVKATGRMFALADYHMPTAEFPYELAARQPGVRVIALTSDRSQVWMTDEFRVETGERDIRLPGGKVKDTLGSYLKDVAAGVAPKLETLREAAEKEFEEEVGLSLLDAELVARSACGSSVLWDLYYFVGIAGDGEPKQRTEAGEDIRPFVVDLDEARRLAWDVMAEERSALQLLRHLERVAKGT